VALLGDLDRFEVRVRVMNPERRWLGLALPLRARVFASVWINGIEATPDCIAIHALLDAVRDGTIFPFTCDCGDPGCAGYMKGVHVVHAGGETLWADQDAGTEHVFATAALREELAKLESTIADARARWPDLVLEGCENAVADTAPREPPQTS
jgi:hypothetical protein